MTHALSTGRWEGCRSKKGTPLRGPPGPFEAFEGGTASPVRQLAKTISRSRKTTSPWACVWPARRRNVSLCHLGFASGDRSRRRDQRPEGNRGTYGYRKGDPEVANRKKASAGRRTRMGKGPRFLNQTGASQHGTASVWKCGWCRKRKSTSVGDHDRWASLGTTSVENGEASSAAGFGSSRGNRLGSGLGRYRRRQPETASVVSATRNRRKAISSPDRERHLRVASPEMGTEVPRGPQGSLGTFCLLRSRLGERPRPRWSDAQETSQAARFPGGRRGACRPTIRSWRIPNGC